MRDFGKGESGGSSRGPPAVRALIFTFLVGEKKGGGSPSAVQSVVGGQAVVSSWCLPIGV